MRKFSKAVVLVLAMMLLGALVIPVAQAGDLFSVSRTPSGTNGGIKRFDGVTGAFISEFVSGGSGGLQDPLGICFGPDGNLYVGDNATGTVKQYDGTTGAYVNDFITGVGGGGPNSIQFGPDGNLYVQPYSTPWVVKYDGLTGANLGNFCAIDAGGVRDFFWTPGGELLVMSPSLNKVFRFALDGTALAEYAMDGNAAGARFTVCASAAGDIYVGAMNRNSIEKYDSNGNFLGELVTNGLGGLNQTTRVRIGPDGNLYASSYNMTMIKKYDISTGAYMGDFATGLAGGGWGFVWQPDAVPEPSSVLSLAVGFFGLAGSIIRRRR